MTAVRGRTRIATIEAVIALLTIACAASGSSLAADTAPEQASDATFVSREVCGSCHAAEAELWQGSHHDQAMQEATEATVLGDFDNATLTHFGVTSTFFRKDGKFFVRTDGPDGTLQDYPIAYTFGVYPLQQYLIAFPGGRYQALSIAWDSRPAAEGGQRWFHLYPDEPMPGADPLHWTGPNQNWNFMCADCHSTNLRKNFDLTANTTARPGRRSTSPAKPATVRARAMSPGRKRRRGRPAEPAKGLLLTFATPVAASGNSIRKSAPRSAPRHASRPPRWRPARAAMRAVARSPPPMTTGIRSSTRTGRPCWSLASITPTGRSSTKSTNTARSGRAACSRTA